jgi:uncharacterized protein YbjT (DUF2867 family)
MFVILGATGNTGSVAAKALLRAGHPVRAVVRDLKKAAELVALGAEVTTADVDDVEALTRAFDGAAGAYVLSPPDHHATDFNADRRRTFAAFAAAAQRARLPHLVLLSSIGAHEPKGTGPIESVAIGEQFLRASGIPLTLVRAAYFVENWLAVVQAVKSDGVLPSFLGKERKIEMVATPDIGRVVAEALLAGPRGERVIELAGPEAQSPADVAAAFARILGRPVAVAEAPLAAVVPAFTSFGFSPHIAGLYRDMFEGLGIGRITFEAGRAELIRGRISVEERLRTALA